MSKLIPVRKHSRKRKNGVTIVRKHARRVPIGTVSKKTGLKKVAEGICKTPEKIKTSKEFANSLPAGYEKRLLKEVEKEAADMVQKDWTTFTPQICNTGFCDIWVELFRKKFGGTYQATDIPDGSGTFGHVFVKKDGKYYDAEVPKGVSKVTDIPYFKRAVKVHKDRLNKTLTEKDILTDIANQ
jgi:hypothetical protein